MGPVTARVDVHVDASDWHARLSEARDEGFELLRFVTAIDRGEELELVACVMRTDPVESVSVRTRLADPRIDSVSDLWPAAVWHERETAEMFGVQFMGLLDTRPLLLHDHDGAPPLRKSVWLAARAERSWPGAFEPGKGRGNASRRRQLPPGVPNPVQS